MLRRLRFEATDPSLMRDGWKYTAVPDRPGVAQAIEAAGADPDPHRRLAKAQELWAERLAIGKRELEAMSGRGRS